MDESQYVNIPNQSPKSFPNIFTKTVRNNIREKHIMISTILFFLFILSLFINQKFWIFTIFFICTYDDKIHICQNTKTPVSSVIFIISINLQSEKQPAVAIIYLFPSNPGISQSFHLEIPPACSTDDHIQLLYNL